MNKQILLRDWRGLAQICMIEDAVLNCYQDPCQEVLNIIQSALKELTIEKLLEHFKRIERIDVINEIEQCIGMLNQLNFKIYDTFFF